MRSVVYLIFLFAASFGDPDLNSKVRNFSMELIYHAVQDSDVDVIISPYAIWYLLISMAYETKGATREHLFKVLSLTENRSEFVAECKKQKTSVVGQTTFLNLLFYDEYSNIYSDSIERLENDFDFKIQRLNFEEPQLAADSAMKTLDSYGRSFLRTLSAEDFVRSTMIMSNHFEFIKHWSKPFKVRDTVRSYYRNETITKQTMYVRAPLRFSNFESLHVSVTELPFSGDTHCMLLVRPHRGYDVHRVFRELRRVSLADILAKLQSDAEEFGLREIEVKIPLYWPESRVALNKPLINMGFSDAFDPNLANFENFVDDDVYVGAIGQQVVVHFAPIRIAVFTSIPTLELRRPKKMFPLKDPFIFFIMEKSTATILFGGSVSKIASYEGGIKHENEV